MGSFLLGAMEDSQRMRPFPAGFLGSALSRAWAACFTEIRNVLAQRRGQIDEVVLLLHENLPDLLRHGELVESLALANPLTVVADGFRLILEVEFQHIAGFFRNFDRSWRDARHLAEIVDLPRDGERMLEFLMRVLLELGGDAHILS